MASIKLDSKEGLLPQSTVPTVQATSSSRTSKSKKWALIAGLVLCSLVLLRPFIEEPIKSAGSRCMGMMHGAHVHGHHHKHGLGASMRHKLGFGQEEPLCAQVGALYPEKETELYEKLGKWYSTEEFKQKAIEYLGGAVRVP